MDSAIRIGLVYDTSPDFSDAGREQRLGAHLAADYTRSLWAASGPALELVERPVTTEEASLERAAEELAFGERCAALLGSLNVPYSIRLAAWTENQRLLYVAANNN